MLTYFYEWRIQLMALKFQKNPIFTPIKKTKTGMTKVNLIDNGPLVVVGEHTITHPDGSQEVKPTRASYCRCEKSANMPFCDGAHKG